MLFQCLTTIYDAGPTFPQHRVNVFCCWYGVTSRDLCYLLVGVVDMATCEVHGGPTDDRAASQLIKPHDGSEHKQHGHCVATAQPVHKVIVPLCGQTWKNSAEHLHHFLNSHRGFSGVFPGSVV